MKNIIIIFVSILISSCFPKNNISEVKLKEGVSEILSNAEFNAMGANIFVNNENKIYLNWTEEIDTIGSNILMYRIFDNTTYKFGKTISVGPSKGMQSHQESMAKIAQTKDGVLYAIFRMETPGTGKRFAGNIYYSISNDEGVNWSEKRKLVKIEAARSQSFFDITLLPDGELGICWLDSRKIDNGKDGSTLYFAKTMGDLGIFDEKPIASSTCQCCRTDIFVDQNKSINIAFRNINEGSIRDMYRVKSIDNGSTFTPPMRMGNDNWKIDGCPHTGPSFAGNSQDLAVTWFTGADSGKGIFFKELSNDYSVLNFKTLVSSKGRHPQMTSLPNGNFYIVYEEPFKENNETFSHIVLHTINDKETEIKKRISDLNTSNDHAVLAMINNDKLLIAWTNKKNDKSNIMFKLISSRSIE